MFLRVAIALQTLAVLAQAVTAGLLLSSPGGRALHATTAIVVAVAVLLHLVAAIVTRGRAAIVPAVAMLVMTLVQIALGVGHVKVLHVPVGVLMFGASMMRLGQVWPARRVPAATA
ncbi:hypothetical protein GCM10010149_13800 [Nonomuraea roseoviolacea subsp. roseoviolacea]|uniref:Cytochrome b n=1 Tax=Nonomuraea roseoviolacea subsp. carminata TaxID=160689 RepID=A0ABT1KBD8_9ACTN|nr:hypothetical protein [Nonomuraea roseoviolacea]MCP2351323.1 cytochrome b [Nonomuraea roseoviolacea subsp. carminata]